MHTLTDLNPMRIERVVVTNVTGTVTILTKPQLISLWLAKVSEVAIEWRKEYDAWCSACPSGSYRSFAISVKP